MEATLPSIKDFETPVKQTLDLPPLAILRVGDIATFVMGEVAQVKDDDNEVRLYYRAQLLKGLECETKEKGATDYNVREFKAGEIVTIPGSGSLDYQMARIANRRAGVEINASPVKWSSFTGDLFIVTRTPDEKMSKGRHKGKAVKAYTVEHAPRKASK